MSAAAQSWGFQRYRNDRAGQAVHRAVELTSFLIKSGVTDIEIVALSAQFLLTNFINNVADTDIDFPSVANLPA